MDADERHETRTTDVNRPWSALAFGAILAVVAVLFLIPLLSHDWPVGDGGLFYAMIGDIIAAGFSLPESTSYQHGVIPFAYPPLGFYLAAGIEEVTGLARSDLLRLLPSTFALTAIGAMFLLADEIGPTPPSRTPVDGLLRGPAQRLPGRHGPHRRRWVDPVDGPGPRGPRHLAGPAHAADRPLAGRGLHVRCWLASQS